MKNQEAIKFLQQLYPNGGHCWLDEQRIEAIGIAVKALQEEPVSDIDFKQELYKAFGQVKDFTLGMRIAKWFYEMGRNYQEPVSERFAFKAIPRLLEMIEPTDRAKSYITKLADTLELEGYLTDAKIVRESLKIMNGEKVAMATMDEEPVSEDLEEASKEWLRPKLDKSYANYGETKMMELTRFDGYAMLDAIEFGAQWKEQQLMANAVDGVVHHFEKCKVASVHYNDPTGVPMAYFTFPEGLSAGDKVKIIVIKEE